MQAQSNSPKRAPSESPLVSSNNNNNESNSDIAVYVPISMHAKKQSGDKSNAVTTMSRASKNATSGEGAKNKENTLYSLNTRYHKAFDDRYKRQQSNRKNQRGVAPKKEQQLERSDSKTIGKEASCEPKQATSTTVLHSNKIKQEASIKPPNRDQTKSTVSSESQKSRNKHRDQRRKELPVLDIGPLFGCLDPRLKFANTTDNGNEEQEHPPTSHSTLTAPRMETEEKLEKDTKLERSKSAGEPNSQETSQQDLPKKNQRIKRSDTAIVPSRKLNDAPSKETLPPNKVAVSSSNTHPPVTIPGRIRTFPPRKVHPPPMSRFYSGRTKWQYVMAMDCEMVGVGVDGKRSMLARVTLVDWNGNVLLDTFVVPQEHVTDYRTYVSDVRPHHVYSLHAMEFLSCRMLVYNWLKAKPILIGHGLKYDLDVLKLTHPWYLIRDSATYLPFTKPCPPRAPKRLRDLAREELGISIQQDGTEHCSVIDARTAMKLYKHKQTDWDSCVEDHLNVNAFNAQQALGAPPLPFHAKHCYSK